VANRRPGSISKNTVYGNVRPYSSTGARPFQQGRWSGRLPCNYFLPRRVSSRTVSRRGAGLERDAVIDLQLQAINCCSQHWLARPEIHFRLFERFTRKSGLRLRPSAQHRFRPNPTGAPRSRDSFPRTIRGGHPRRRRRAGDRSPALRRKSLQAGTLFTALFFICGAEARL